MGIREGDDGGDKDVSDLLVQGDVVRGGADMPVFDFFEEALNFISNQGFTPVSEEDEKYWSDLMERATTRSLRGGENTESVLMVLTKPTSNSISKPTNFKQEIENHIKTEY